MHRHDLDLIAALADGTLEDETQARARVESCDECRREYEAQTAVLAALRAAPGAAMTEHEKAALHRDLWTELRTGSATSPKRSIPWWYRLSYAAAGLFVVVGLVSVITQIGGEDNTESAASFNEIGSDLVSADESPAVPELAESAEQAAGGLSGADDGAGESGLKEQLDSLRFSAVRSESLQANLHEECLATAELEEHRVVTEVDYADTIYLVAVPEDEPDDSSDVTYVDATTCRVVEGDE